MERAKDKILNFYNYDKKIMRLFKEYIFTPKWKFLFYREGLDKIDGTRTFFIFLLWDIEVDVLRIVGLKKKNDKIFSGETRFYEHTKNKISKNFNLKMNVIDRLNIHKYLNKPIKTFTGKYHTGYLSCNNSVLGYLGVVDFHGSVIMSFDPTNLDIIMSIENFDGLGSWTELIRYENKIDVLRNQCFSHILPDYDKIIGIKT